MPATDRDQQLREATAAILAANAGVIALCAGRIVDRATPGPAIALPAIAYELTEYAEATGRAEILLTGLADEADGHGKARELVKAAVDALTQSAFAAQSYALQVAPSAPITPRQDEVGLFEVEGLPNFRQADRVLPVLVLD